MINLCVHNLVCLSIPPLYCEYMCWLQAKVIENNTRLKANKAA